MEAVDPKGAQDDASLNAGHFEPQSQGNTSTWKNDASSLWSGGEGDDRNENKYMYKMLSAEDEHVTVWEPATGKTVAGNAAPYRKNLPAWLATHPGWEEKADELKSSKRRSAARRAKTADTNFTELCKFTPIASVIINDLGGKMKEIAAKTGTDLAYVKAGKDLQLSSDAVVGLQEAFIEIGRKVFTFNSDITKIGENRWNQFAFTVDSKKNELLVLSYAQDMIVRRRNVICRNHSMDTVGSPISPVSDIPFPNEFMKNSQSESIPNFLARPGRPQREPRVTVWNPESGRTVSGNAAPCRRNLAAWITAHPGWEPKAEDQLSSSRRKKTKSRSKSPPVRRPFRPVTRDTISAADTLILLNKGPTENNDDAEFDTSQCDEEMVDLDGSSVYEDDCVVTSDDDSDYEMSF